MRRKVLAIFTLVCAVIGMPVWAADDDGVMGNWEGQFADSEWAPQPLTAKIVAEGSNTWRAMIFIGSEQGAHTMAEVTGMRRGEDDVQFNGDVDLGKDFGGKYTLSARLTGPEAIEGALEARAKTIGFTMKRVILHSPAEGLAPPEGATVLMDGTNLDQWHTVLRWPLNNDGTTGPAGGNFVSKPEFGSCQIHVEFKTPFMPGERGQARGNSGVYVNGRYEIQVLDNFGWPPADNLCGGIYKVAVPIANAVYPPLTWQTYDITFHAPKFDADGKKTENARLHVEHNGIVIHENLELPTLTPGGVSDQESATGPLMLQDHGDGVRYRNVWVKPLEE